MNLKDYIELRDEEKSLRKKYKDITYKKSEELYLKFKTEWEEYLIDVFDLLEETKEEEVKRIRIGDYGFTFVIGDKFFAGDEFFKQIEIYQYKKTNFSNIEYLFSIDETDDGWKSRAYRGFNPQIDFFTDWEESVKELLEKTPEIKLEMEERLKYSTNKAVEEVEKRVKKIKNNLENLK